MVLSCTLVIFDNDIHFEGYISIPQNLDLNICKVLFTDCTVHAGFTPLESNQSGLDS